MERKVRDSCGESVAKGDPEGLEWKLTIRFTNPQKRSKPYTLGYLYIMMTKWITKCEMRKENN
ncbi:hypothetical protein KEH51_01845 [[Brevibacterium] frigoritolerans]|uniref:Uncharacterized protein n=1 Tax=Peribacillus frigoritolerans TaxID=450367 RepID=A0A941FGP3_9BACI|nr:hypothetical protein [Peribacillus frigoritolerans]